MSVAFNNIFPAPKAQATDLSGMAREVRTPSSYADGANCSSQPMTRTGGIFSQHDDSVSGERRALNLKYNSTGTSQNNLVANTKSWGSGASTQTMRSSAWTQFVSRQPYNRDSGFKPPHGVYYDTSLNRTPATENNNSPKELTVAGPSSGSMESRPILPVNTGSMGSEPFCHDLPIDSLTRTFYDGHAPIAPVDPMTFRYTMEEEKYIGANNATANQRLNPTIFRQVDEEEVEMTEEEKKAEANVIPIVYSPYSGLSGTVSLSVCEEIAGGGKGEG